MTGQQLAGAGAALTRHATSLFPAEFSIVMATGIISVDGLQLGYDRIGRALFALNLVAWLLVWLAGFVRLVASPAALLREMGGHDTGPAFLAATAATAVAATAVLGNQFAALPLAPWLALPFFALSAVLWVITQYAFLAGVSEGRTKPSLEQGFSGQWLLLVVSTQGLAALGSEVLTQPDPSPALTFACCALVLLGAIYYVLLGPIILYRFFFVAMPAQDITGPWWINEGAAAITVLAMAKLMMIPDLKVGSFVVRQLLGPFVIGFWADATFWIPLLVLLFAWKHLMRGQILCYSVALWSVVFPLGMYSAATLALADACQLPFLHVIGRVFFWIAFVAWCGVLVGALQSIRIPAIRRS